MYIYSLIIYVIIFGITQDTRTEINYNFNISLNCFYLRVRLESIPPIRPLIIIHKN